MSSVCVGVGGWGVLTLHTSHPTGNARRGMCRCSGAETAGARAGFCLYTLRTSWTTHNMVRANAPKHKPLVYKSGRHEESLVSWGRSKPETIQSVCIYSPSSVYTWMGFWRLVLGIRESSVGVRAARRSSPNHVYYNTKSSSSSPLRRNGRSRHFVSIFAIEKTPARGAQPKVEAS